MADQQFVTGFISKDGAKISGAGDYTVVKAGGGLYNVVFAPPFVTLPVVVATQVYPNDLASSGGDTRDNAVVVGVSERQFRVKTGGSSGAGADRDFTFVAVGVGLSGAALEEWEAEERRREAGNES